MKTLLTILFSLLFFVSTAQDMKNNFHNTILKIKSETIIDKNDTTALGIINNFYQEVLQSEKGELESNTATKLQNFMSANNSKNKHLLILFLMYQQHISETAGKGLKPNADFQILAISTLEKEFIDLYKKIPCIVYIYKSEALSSANKQEEAKETVKLGLDNFPNSIPLKVYRYLDTKDEKLKKDLVVNHPNHWLVQEKGIK